MARSCPPEWTLWGTWRSRNLPVEGRGEHRERPRMSRLIRGPDHCGQTFMQGASFFASFVKSDGGFLHLLRASPLRVSWSRMFSHRTDWKLTPNRFTQVQQELRAAGREV